MKKMQKRFEKRDGTLRTFLSCGCLCSCAAIGCEFDPGSSLHVIYYNQNRSSTDNTIFWSNYY